MTDLEASLVRAVYQSFVRAGHEDFFFETLYRMFDEHDVNDEERGRLLDILDQ